MDDVVNRFARELADAIAAAVAENPQVEACRERARAAGFEMKVTLEAVVGFVSRTKCDRSKLSGEAGRRRSRPGRGSPHPRTGVREHARDVSPGPPSMRSASPRTKRSEPSEISWLAHIVKDSRPS